MKRLKSYKKSVRNFYEKKFLPVLRQRLPDPVKLFLIKHFVYAPIIREKHFTLQTPPLFDSIFFEVRTRCNGQCPFCPASVSTDTRADISMSPGIHEKVLHELAALQFKGRVAYHNNNDPLIFKPIAEFARTARTILPDCQIQILTNGRALTQQNAEALVDAGISELTINFYHDDLTVQLPQKFYDIGTAILPKYYPVEELDISGLGSLDRRNPHAKFHYHVRRRKQNEVLSNHAGLAPNKNAEILSSFGFCQFPWTHCIITADGRVLQCCCDFYGHEPLGDVNHQTILEIWHGEKFYNLRKTLLQGNRAALSLCRHCDGYGVKHPPKTRIGRFIYKLTKPDWKR